jgi:hypothetical protein
MHRFTHTCSWTGAEKIVLLIVIVFF